MSDIQKIIKYFAMAFAIFLAVSIISGILGATVITGLVISNDKTVPFETHDVEEVISELYVEATGIKINIEEGDKLSWESNNKYIKYEVDNGKLVITQKKFSLFSSNKSQLNIYIPKDYVFDYVSIDGIAGKLSIDEINAKEFYLDCGAGKVDIDYLNVTKETHINGGAGAMTIKDGKLHNLELNMGVGKVSITSLLTGTSNIDAGVGEMELDLIGSLNDYKITLDKGIGSATIDGKEFDEEKEYGTGSNTIDIDGGVGSIKIKFVKGETTNFTKTYEVIAVKESQEESYMYLTLAKFQSDDVETVKIKKELCEDITVDNYYEFTFSTNSTDIEDNIESIFEKATIISIEKTTKTGLDQTQDTI